LLQVFATMQSTALWSGSIGCITYTGRPHLNIDMHSWHQKSIELVRVWQTMRLQNLHKHTIGGAMCGCLLNIWNLAKNLVNNRLVS